MNDVVNNNSLSLADRTTAVCNSTDAVNNGIGIGTGQVNSSLCTSSTLITVSSATADPSTYAFADKVYPTPVVHRHLGATIYSASAGR